MGLRCWDGNTLGIIEERRYMKRRCTTATYQLYILGAVSWKAHKEAQLKLATTFTVLCSTCASLCGLCGLRPLLHCSYTLFPSAGLFFSKR